MGIKTSMYLESIRCSSQHICCHFLLKDAKRSWLRTYKLRCTTLLAQPIWLLPSLNTAWNSSGPLLIASEKKWWNHIFSPYALRKAINHLPYLLSKADLDSVMILLHEKRVSTASNRSNWKLSYQVPQCRLNCTFFPGIKFEQGNPTSNKAKQYYWGTHFTCDDMKYRSLSASLVWRVIETGKSLNG